MAKQRAPLEFNSLAGGIITEASPLTFPDSASLDEVNFELRSDGTRRRRQGFEFEADFEQHDLNLAYALGNPSVVSSFLWQNVSGQAATEYAVIQVDNAIHIYSTGGTSLSSGRLGGITLELPFSGNVYGFANIDGALVIVTGSGDITTVTADLSAPETPAFSESTSRLTMRDLFGIQIQYDRSVEDEAATEADLIDLTDPIYITKRPLLAGLPTQTSGALIDFATDGSTYFAATSGIPPVIVSEYVSSDNNWVFTPDTYEGYEIERYRADYAAAGEKWLYITFATSTGIPAFDSLEVIDNITGTTFTLVRTPWDAYKYLTYDITLVEFTALKDNAPAGFDFSIDGTVVGSLYNYNLRNQTFGVKRLPKSGTEALDPITAFLDVEEKLPSMSDSIISALYPNTEEANKTADRFHAEDLAENPLGSFPAPKGYFIIDALDRSESRKERWGELIADQDLDEIEFSDMPVDITPGGPRTVAEYGGRLWYGGFSEEGSVSAAGATRLESYLLYSQLANSKAVLTRCYQSGDPTSIEAPELLDTDGGFLSLDGAYGIQRLVPLGNSLLVFSENGVWAVSGNDGNYFTPTSPRLQKVTDKGSASSRAIVVIDTSVMYWARDGIYLINLSELGGYEVNNLTDKTIQTLYSEISFTDKRSAVGTYDSYTSSVSWVYHNTLTRTEQTELLILKTTTGAFTKYVVSEGDSDRTLVGQVTIPPYTIETVEEVVTVGAETVTVDGEDVTITTPAISPRTSTSKGIVISNISGSSNISFGSETNEDFLDWGEEDAPGYIITGYVSGGDYQRHKQVPYATFHFERTEDGFYEDVEGDLYPLHESSCKVQAQWDWANSVNSGRWSREFQAYRYRKLYSPSGVTDTFDTGFSTIITKNKLRGKGRVLSLKLSTEEGKDCRILGWSAMMGVNNNV